jgi:arylsulfatase A-like enzyme
MSLYGYARATTPAFVRLAGQSYNFVNFSSTADFTSPAVASLLTGQYPLRHRVFELYGHIPRRAQSHNLAWVLRHHGYTTAAIVTNPGAHPLALHIGSSFSYLPWPPITPWFIAGTFLLQLRHSLLYTSADALSLFGARLLGFAFPSFNQHGWVSARAVFAAARQFIRGTPQPYFLWLHIYPPHAPYVSDPPFRGRFLRGDEFATQEQFLWSLPGPPYAPAQQPIVDKLRLRYDESLAEADNALGQFVQWLDRSGRRQHVLLIVTADHGESFEAGWLGHGSPYLRYAETHIPLLISMPGQHQGAIRAQDADLSDVAPTVLAALGIATPPWMDGHALLGAAAAPAEPSFAMYLVQSSPQGPPPTGILAATANGRRLIWFFPQNALVLYDLRSDPNQLHDISFLHPQTVADLMAALRARFRAQVDMSPRAPAL